MKDKDYKDNEKLFDAFVGCLTSWYDSDREDKILWDGANKYRGMILSRLEAGKKAMKAMNEIDNLMRLGDGEADSSAYRRIHKYVCNYFKYVCNYFGYGDEPDETERRER